MALDTNVLVRAAMRDNEVQSEAALRLLREAEALVIGLPALCEFAWVLARCYRLGRADIGQAIHSLVEADKVIVDRSAVDAGLAVLAAGGDFADGVIAHDGRRAGAAGFATFDKNACSKLRRLGYAVELLA